MKDARRSIGLLVAAYAAFVATLFAWIAASLAAWLQSGYPFDPAVFIAGPLNLAVYALGYHDGHNDTVATLMSTVPFALGCLLAFALAIGAYARSPEGQSSVRIGAGCLTLIAVPPAGLLLLWALVVVLARMFPVAGSFF